MRKAAAPAIFIAFFALYLAALFPALAPYRDSGEMASSAQTLGVAHPTSYPLYVLLGRLAEALPLGNPGYRLGLLSALGAAAALALLCWLIQKRWGLLPALGAAVLLGLNATFWSVAIVQEMYSLWVLAAAAALGLALESGCRRGERSWFAFVFLYGLLLCNRLDLLLWAPGLVWLALDGWPLESATGWASFAFLLAPGLIFATDKNFWIVPLVAATAWWRYRGLDRARWAVRTGFFAVLGLSVYAYLPLRSATGPWLDWNHPAAPANLLESLLRTRYGGTLDLLSRNYAKGSLFGEQMKLYAAHLWESFSLVGLSAVLLGAWRNARREPRRWLGMAACYWWSGPFFLLLANLPPNPHANAIVDPHYLSSDVILVFWAAEGLAAFRDKRRWLAAAALAALLVVPICQGRWAARSKRFHFFSEDFARNVFMSAPPKAALIAKKDIQLYALWHYQLALGLRPDVRVVAQGLAGSPWYQNGWRRRDPELALWPLIDADGWKKTIVADAPLAAEPSAEIPAELLGSARPRGWVSVWSEVPGAESEALWELSVLRGNYSYEYQPDFFTSDLVDSAAQSLYRLANLEFHAGKNAEAERALLRAWSMRWLFPEPPALLGFLRYQAGDYKEARRYYQLSSFLSVEMEKEAVAYRALPGIFDNIRRSRAETLTHLGVVSEKLGDARAAEEYYQRSIALVPTAQAHYDYAVLYWSRDPKVAEREFEEALRLDPGRADAAKYLAVLRARRR